MNVLRLDDRAGSRELYSPLLAVGAKVHMTRLPYGDVEFDGHGPDDLPLLIGIEHKQVSDVLKCMQDGRFSGHQLPGLMARYDYSWLVVEGCTRGSPTGQLQVETRGRWYDAAFGSRGIRAADFDMWLTSIEVLGGCRVRRTRDQGESATWIVALYQWFQKRWSDHRSHVGFDQSSRGNVAQIVKPGIVRRMAKELPGVGWERSGAIEAVFASPVEMIAATESEWADVDGIGRTTARKIMRELGSDKLWGGDHHVPNTGK